MAREFAKAFYKSAAWNKCREGYAAYRGYLCERCLAKGKYTPGKIVHHKTYLTPDNITDPDIALNWNNLELVCQECHNAEHEGVPRRYSIDANGAVVANE